MTMVDSCQQSFLWFRQWEVDLSRLQGWHKAGSTSASCFEAVLLVKLGDEDIFLVHEKELSFTACSVHS